MSLKRNKLSSSNNIWNRKGIIWSSNIKDEHGTNAEERSYSQDQNLIDFNIFKWITVILRAESNSA